MDERPRVESEEIELAALAELVGRWRLGGLVEARRAESGTINRTVLLKTERGRFALRGYRHLELEPIAREHAAIAHARAGGLPAVAPLPLPSGGLVGGAVQERGGRYYALFPWAPGRQVRRAEVGPGEAAAMGACLARLHVALADFPVEAVPVPRRSPPPSRTEALAAMEELEARVRATLPVDSLAPTALARLAEQRAHLKRLPDGAAEAADAAREQVIHGDFQETNLFFGGGEASEGTEDSQVTAIIDWDQTHFAPRASEIFRTFDYVFDFEAERCRRFLRAYRAFQALPLEELDAAAREYDAKRSRGLWLYEELYVRGNRRVAQFIERSGPYEPVSERWARVRDACAPEAAEAADARPVTAPAR